MTVNKKIRVGDKVIVEAGERATVKQILDHSFVVKTKSGAILKVGRAMVWPL